MSSSTKVFARPGSVIPVGARDDGPDYDYADGVTFFAYEKDEGAFEGEVEVIGADCRPACSVKITGDASGCAVSFKGGETSKTKRLLLRGVDAGRVRAVVEGAG